MLATHPPAPRAVAASVAGLLWFLIALFVLMWMWEGPNRTAFGSPDEALTARATQLIAETGTPLATSPYDDPEGLFRTRLWAVTDAGAIPTHPTFLLFAFGLIERAVPGGEWAVLLLPSLGLAALGAVGVLVMRRWYAVGALLPLFSFPFLYRFTHPWENMAQYSALLAIAALFGLMWFRSRRPIWLYATAGVVLFAAAIRPDQIHILLGLAWLGALLGATKAEAGTATTTYLSVGLVVTTLVLIGNVVVTGDAFTHPFYLLEGPAGTEITGKNLPPPLSNIVSLVLPKGLPEFDLIAFQAGKYFWNMGPVRWVTLGTGAAIIAAVATGLRWRRYRQLGLGLGAALLLILLFVSRINSTDWGAADLTGSVSHSLPRYIALAWIVAGIFVFGVVGRIRSRALGVVTAAAIVAVSFAGGAHLLDGERTSISTTAELAGLYQDYADEIDAATLPNAVLYTRFTDKFVWDIRPVAVVPSDLEDPDDAILFDPLAASMRRVIAAGGQPYIFEVTADEVDILRGYGFSVEPVPMTDNAALRAQLIRWTMYVVNPA